MQSESRVDAPVSDGSIIWRTARRVALIFIPLALVTLAVTYLLYASQASAVRAIADAADSRVIEVARQRFVLSIEAAVADLSYLADQEALRAYLERGDADSLDHLEAHYLSLARHRTAFDQVRLIDTAGQEVLRINRSGERVTLVPPDRLQNRAEEHDTQNALKLDRGQVFISALDLNIENDAIEQPIKPAMRIATPVFDRDGTKRGIVVINYLAQPILDRIEALETDTAQIWLLNADGYWLLGPSEESFAFMYPEREARTFAATYPEAWQDMQAAPTGQITNEAGRFTYARAETTEVVDQIPPELAPTWLVVIHTPSSILAGQTAELRRNMGAAAGGFLLVFAFVSVGLARHQIRRQDSERRVRLSEGRFRDLLESAPDAVLIADEQGRIQLVNAQTERLFGYRRDELIGQKIEELVPERYRGQHVGYRAGYQRDARTRPMGAGLELYALRKDGSEFPVSIGLSPTRTEHGLTVFCGVRDITEQKASEAKIQELNQRLQLDNAELMAVNKELEAFSYSVSHDLRAPLRAIDGFSQALVEDAGPLLSAEHRSHLDRVRQAAQRMGLLIDDMIKLARVTRTDIRIDDVDLTETARQITANLRDSAPERQAEFVIAPDLHVEGDLRLLQVALENLLHNSWKFTAPRSLARIEFGRTEADGSQIFFVRDNGVGFDMTYAGKMFGAFQRFHDAREFAGTGIGLATVQRIIHKHGGRIWAESEPSNGATFFFTV